MMRLKLLAILVSLVSAVFTACAPAPQKQAPLESSTAAVDGKSLYDSNCASCHGSAGAGGSASPLNTQKNTQDVVEVTKSGMNPVMPGFKDKLNDNQIKAIADYVVSLKKG